MNLSDKKAVLLQNIKEARSMIIAFSGGVDSTYLLKEAYQVLGKNVIAVTARSASFPTRELNEAIQFAESMGVEHILIDSEELDIPGFEDNPPDRCYHCKHELFGKIKAIAVSRSINIVADGSNADDINDYRPGMKAVKEHGVISPLREAGLTKADIRALSKELGLATWDKPAFACLSSRFPYGEKITRQKLSMVEAAEQVLLDLGFKQVRVRHHGEIARIEVAPAERIAFLKEGVMESVDEALKKIGFSYSALDLKGYRTGSMNETLKIRSLKEY